MRDIKALKFEEAVWMPVGGYITRSEISGSWSIDNCGNKGTSSYPILNNRKPLKGEAER